MRSTTVSIWKSSSYPGVRHRRTRCSRSFTRTPMEIIKNANSVTTVRGHFNDETRRNVWTCSVVSFERGTHEFGAGYPRETKSDQGRRRTVRRMRTTKIGRDGSLPPTREEDSSQTLYAKLVKKPRRFIRRANIEIGPAYDRRSSKTHSGRGTYRFVEGITLTGTHLCA